MSTPPTTTRSTRAGSAEYPTTAVSHKYELASAPTRCPVCGGAAFGWLTLPDPASKPTVGRLAEVDRVVDLCEDCGAGVERAGEGQAPIEIDPDAELEAAMAAGPIPNRASFQAWLGGDSWSRLDRWQGHLLFTPRAVGHVGRSSTTGRAIGAMWQTMLNGFTFNQNFAREVRAGRLRPASPQGRGRAAFAVDCLVTVLAAPLTGIAAVLLESFASLIGRGGVINVGDKLQ